MTKSEDLEFLKNYIISERRNIIYIHFAPPCRTCSAARNKRHRDLEEAGFILPKPVRSKEHPMGLPSNRGLDAAKVASENLLYFATLEIAKLQYDILFSIENPEKQFILGHRSHAGVVSLVQRLSQCFSKLHDGRRQGQTNKMVVVQTELQQFQCFVQ